MGTGAKRNRSCIFREIRALQLVRYQIDPDLAAQECIKGLSPLPAKEITALSHKCEPPNNDSS
jgi:hypothetical protein